MKLFFKIMLLLFKVKTFWFCFKKVKELFPYFDPDPLLKHTIYAQCHKIQTMEDVYGEDVSVKEAEIRKLEHLDIPSDTNRLKQKINDSNTK